MSRRQVLSSAAPEEVPLVTVTIKFFGEHHPMRIAVASDGPFEKIRNSDLTRASADLFRAHFQHHQRVRAAVSGGNRLAREHSREGSVMRKEE